VRLVAVLLVLVATALPAQAEDQPRPIVGFRVRGKSKLTERTCGWLSHVEVGDPVTPEMIPQLEAALMSSELFETATVTLEDAPGGVLVVATLKDKLSWIAAPTLFVLPSHWAVGAGYAESDINGENKKMLLYGQLGNRTSLFLGTFLDPSVRGTKWQTRFDIYLLHEITDEYANPVNDAASFAIDRSTTMTFLDAGALIGYRLAWWLVGDLRLRGAYVYYRDAHADDAAQTPLPVPEKDGWDLSLQARMTIDARSHKYGVTWGPYAQLILEPSVPGLDSYHYQLLKARAYYSWRFFEEHELELRTRLLTGRNLPFHEEQTLGGVPDLRGYAVDQFRGDLAWMARAEYSVPLAKWRFFAFRALGFWDSGFEADYDHPARATRNYLPDQIEGRTWFRNDVGVGFRVYVKSIVLPLLGLDLGYGLESRAPEVYFEIGLTDF
jgi:outer membrane protein insertion porin family